MTTTESPNSNLYLSSILCLVLCIGLLGWRITTLTTESTFRVQGLEEQALAELFSTPLGSSSGEKLTLAAEKSPYVLLFFFTPADCSAALPELHDLAQIENDRKDLKVYGILAYSDQDEARQVQESFNFSFPILLDGSGKILEGLAVPKTPWKAVINTRTHEVVLQDPPSITEVERQAFLLRAKRLGFF